MKSRIWQEWECRILERVYPEYGAKACIKAGIDRTPEAIRAKAREFDLRGVGGNLAGQLPTTPEIDRIIRLEYGVGRDHSSAREIARRVRRPLGWVHRRARELGVSRTGIRTIWGADEDAILTRMAGHSVNSAMEALQRAGYTRSWQAVARRMNLLQANGRNPDGMLTSQGIADCMGVGISTVLRWCNAGKIKSRTRDATGCRLVNVADLRAFLIEHPSAWDHRLCDKIWLIDILAGRVGDGRIQTACGVREVAA